MRILFVFLSLAISVNSLRSQSINYQGVFGDDWKKALAFEKENRSWMEPLLTEYHLSYPMSIAVIFPELVRYSALRDKMEITLLKALYVNLGNEYANFSIGQFQMKPSFAEMILSEAPREILGVSGLDLKVKSDFADIINFRKSIVGNLEDVRTQFKYLVAFIKICEKKYDTTGNDEIQRLKFLATAYNCGIDKSASLIERMTDKKFFNTKLYKTENYSYADVSLFWYREHLEGK